MKRMLIGLGYFLLSVILAIPVYADKVLATFSDPYDFRRDDKDWRVRIFGRLYHYGWISKFNVNGKFTINVKE